MNDERTSHRSIVSPAYWIINCSSDMLFLVSYTRRCTIRRTLFLRLPPQIRATLGFHTTANVPWNRPSRLTSRDRDLLTAISTGTPNSFPSVLTRSWRNLHFNRKTSTATSLFEISLLAKSCGVNDWPIVNRRESKTQSRANDRPSGYERSAFLRVTSSGTVNPLRHDNGCIKQRRAI